MSALAELLRDLDGERSSKSTILPEAVIERLKEAAALIKAPNPYKEGDIVTPRKGFNVRGHGQPHLVVAVNETGFHYGTHEAGQSGSAEIHNVHLVCMGGENLATFAIAHWKLEPFTQN